MNEPSLYPELDEQLDIIDTDPDAAASSGMFTVDSLDKANWAMSKLAERDAALAEAQAAAMRMQRRIGDWIAGEERRHEHRTAFLRGQLERWHRERRETDPDLKTIKLPAGEHWARPAPDQWDYEDPAAFVAWAEEAEREDLIRRPDPQPDKNAVKKALTVAAHDEDDIGPLPVIDPDSGETIPGLTVTPGGVSYTARPHIDGGGLS